MKKSIKCLSAVLMTSVMAVSASAMTMSTLTASASTLTVTDSETADHSYYAYQIITGTKASGSDALGNMAWGTGVDSATLIAALKTNATALGITLGAAPTINDVATALAGITDADKKQLLAKVFNETGVLTTTKTQLTRSTTAGHTDEYSADLADGWYLVLDESTLDSTSGPTVASANILQIVGDTEIATKHSVPSLEKKILDGTPVDVNEANIGDTITYRITVPVPDVRGYDKYYYNISDTLSAGLTYTNAVTIAADNGTPGDTSDDITFVADSGVPATSTKDHYYVTVGDYSSTSGTAIKLVFEDCINTFKGKAGNIVISYTAKLNQNADATTAGNPNTAKLTYSNNPNYDYSGDTDSKPDEPDSGQVTGETPPDTVRTYTTSLKLVKVDGAAPTTKLTGAEFEITGTDINQVVVVSKTKFVVDTEGTYYKLKNGTYTQTAPTTSPTDTTALYDSTTTKYKMVTDTASFNEAMSNSSNKITAIVDADGYLTLKGIGAGTYTIRETKAPAGYNLLTDSITMNVAATDMTDAGAVTWSATKTGDTTEYFVTADNCVEVTIANNKGATLPGTGGIGTTVFYIIGGLMITGALVLFIVKKRMNIKEK